MAAISVIFLLTGIAITRHLSYNDQASQEELPSVIQSCKDYLYETDSPKKNRIDYSIYRIRNLSYEEYRQEYFTTDRVINESNIKDYIMVVIGNTQLGDIGAHDYVALLVEKKTETVCGQAPVK